MRGWASNAPLVYSFIFADSKPPKEKLRRFVSLKGPARFIHAETSKTAGAGNCELEKNWAGIILCSILPSRLLSLSVTMSTGCPVLSSNIINKCPTNITSHKSQVWAARIAWWCRVLPVRRPPSHWRGDTRPVAAPAAPPACSAPTCPAGLSPTVWVFKLLVKSDTSDQPRAVHPGSEYRNDKA